MKPFSYVVNAQTGGLSWGRYEFPEQRVNLKTELQTEAKITNS